VGKSTLFNRLTQTRAAIVDDTSGTTRDRQYGKMEWNGMEMSVVDTGGWVVNSEDIFEGEINKQVQLAIDEADVILFVVDIKNGVTSLDDHVADILRRCRKPVIVVTNKDDNNEGIYAEGDEVAVMVNGMGATPLSELFIANLRVKEILDEKKISIAKTVVGNYMTSLDMAGFSVTLLKLDDELKGFLNAPADTPAYKEI
jgi:small GTP-binding protein